MVGSHGVICGSHCTMGGSHSVIGGSHSAMSDSHSVMGGSHCTMGGSHSVIRHVKRHFFLHKHGLSQKYFTQRSAQITTNLICNKTALNAQKAQIVKTNAKKEHKFTDWAKKCHQKGQNHEITQFLDKKA